MVHPCGKGVHPSYHTVGAVGTTTTRQRQRRTSTPGRNVGVNTFGRRTLSGVRFLFGPGRSRRGEPPTERFGRSVNGTLAGHGRGRNRTGGTRHRRQLYQAALIGGTQVRESSLVAAGIDRDGHFERRVRVIESQQRVFSVAQKHNGAGKHHKLRTAPRGRLDTGSGTQHAEMDR